MAQTFHYSFRKRSGSYSWRRRRTLHSTSWFVLPRSGGRKEVTKIVEHKNAYGNGDRRTS